MRTLLTSLLAVPVLLIADLGIELAASGQLEAEAADFRGRIKRVRIRERTDGQYAAVVVTENSPDQVANPGHLEIRLSPIGGGPALIPQADTPTERVEDLRFETVLPSVQALFGVVFGVNTTKGSAEVPLDALLDGEDPASFGAPFVVGTPDDGLVEVRARLETDADGNRVVDLSVRGRGDQDLVGTTLAVKGTWADNDAPFAQDATLLGAVRRHTLLFSVEAGDLDPADFAYDLVGRWTFDDSAAQDVSRATVDLDGTADGPRVEKMVLGATRRGDTRLVTRVSSPDDRPLVLEATVSEADGASVIGVADGAPVWTERQFAGSVLFGGDPTGVAYPVTLIGRDADGLPVTEGVSTVVTAERPSTGLPSYEGAFFADDTAMVALLPETEDSWQLVVHAVTDAPVASWTLQFDEPFEGPVPSSTIVDAPLEEVWRQYRQVARGVPLATAQRTVSTSVSGEDGSLAAQASGTEVEGAVVNSARKIDDVDVFISELVGDTGGALQRIRRSRMRRLRR